MHTSLTLVAGLGKTGLSVARYLRRRNKPFVVFDTRTEPAGLLDFQREFPEIDVFLGVFPSNLYTQLEAIVSSPGIAIDEPFIQDAVAHGIPVFGDIECLVRDIQAPIVAITGTNGKSTVTTLVGEMARAANRSVAVAGNIGLPVLDMLDVGATYDLWVLELSSFQLEVTRSLAPHAATILNITPDHLDRHHTLEAYAQAKQGIYQGAKTVLYNRDAPETMPQTVLPAEKHRVSFGLSVPQAGQWGMIEEAGVHYLARGEQRLLAIDALRIKGRHNWANALAACALAETIGVSMLQMKEVLSRFAGLPHRSQWVRTLDGVDWVNDSKGTNIGATLSAISGIGGSMQGKIVLIAGGQGKGADFSALCNPVGDYVRAVVLIGEDAPQIEQALDGVVPVVHAPSLNTAVSLAKTQAQPGDVVLLSPACASLDMFRDFNHRGDEFIAAVNAL